MTSERKDVNDDVCEGIASGDFCGQPMRLCAPDGSRVEWSCPLPKGHGGNCSPLPQMAIKSISRRPGDATSDSADDETEEP